MLSIGELIFIIIVSLILVNLFPDDKLSVIIATIIGVVFYKIGRKIWDGIISAIVLGILIFILGYLGFPILIEMLILMNDLASYLISIFEDFIINLII